MEQVVFGLNIVEIIEKEVCRLVEDYWSNDDCPPVFWASLNNENPNNQSIMITINHNGIKFTERLFPRNNTDYGYDSVINQMINMYNQTM